MTPAPFSSVRPHSLSQALVALAEGDGRAGVLAGGRSLPRIYEPRLFRPDTVVDVNARASLTSIGAGPSGSLVLGALVRHTDLIRAPLVCDRAPLLVEATRHVDHLAIRHAGTLGASLAQTDPAAELPAAAVALDATLVLAGPRGTRTVRAGDFFRGLSATVARPDEMLIEVHVPSQEIGWGFAEIARRPGDFALAGVAVTLRPVAGAPRRCAEARIVGYGVGQAPLRLREAEALLVGATLDATTAVRVGAAAARASDAPDHPHASREYRRHLASMLTEGVVLQAIARLDRA